MKYTCQVKQNNLLEKGTPSNLLYLFYKEYRLRFASLQLLEVICIQRHGQNECQKVVRTTSEETCILLKSPSHREMQNSSEVRRYLLEMITVLLHPTYIIDKVNLHQDYVSQLDSHYIVHYYIILWRSGHMTV